MDASFSDALTNALLVNLNAAVAVITRGGETIVWNRSAEILFDYAREELSGAQNCMRIHAPESLEALRGELSQVFGVTWLSDIDVLFSAAERLGRVRRSWKCRARHGGLFNVDISLALIPHNFDVKGGEAIRSIPDPQDDALLIIMRDVGDKQDLAELKTTFFSRLSHEMRTPLHGVIGAMELLAATELTVEQDEIVRLARSKAEILLSLINYIFEYSRSQGRSLSLESVPAEPRTMMVNIVEVLNERLAAQNVSFSIAIADDVPYHVLCDPVRLYQVLLTVVSALAQFMFDGVIHIALEFVPGINEDFGGLYFTVKGVSARIDEAKRSHILALLQHEEETFDVSAEGLQLSLARSVILAIGGFFWSEKKESPNMHETTLYIVVGVENPDAPLKKETTNDISPAQKTAITSPIAQTEAKVQMKTTIESESKPEVKSEAKPEADTEVRPKESLSGSVSSQPAAQTARGAQKRILIADDDPDNCNLAMLFLQDLADAQGVRPTLRVARNGEEALKAAAEERFDVILMDIQMPVMDGFEATERIRALERERSSERAAILAVTAHTMENYRELCLQKGMDDYMSKPIKKQHLQYLVSKWLQRRPVILLADDSEEYRLLLKLQFDRAGKYAPMYAANGQEAIHLCQTHNIEAIVMDMQMPVLTGYEAVPILRQMPKYWQTPIWGLTAHNGEEEIKKVLDAGCNKCFTKENLSVIRQIIADLDAHFAVKMNETKGKV
jgi:CheY-like chemotaxis protein